MLALIAAIVLLPLSAYAAPDPCKLLSTAELERTQNAKFSAAVPTVRETGQFSTAQCFYRMQPESSSVSLQVLRHSPKKSVSIRDFWRKKFHPSKEDEAEEKADADHEREEKEREHQRAPQHLDGVGDDAFWVDTGRDGALYAIAGDQILRLSLGGSASQAEKMKKAAELAKTVIERLSPKTQVTR